MSYANQQATWVEKQSSIGAAFIINGLIIAGLALTSHAVQIDDTETNLHMFDVKPQTIPPDLPEPTKEAAKLPPINAPVPPLPLPPSDIFIEATPLHITNVPIVSADSLLGSADVPIPTPPTVTHPIIPDPIFIGAQRNPKYARNFQPEYPGALLRQDIEGKVKLRFLIGADGRVKLVEILSASHPKFAAAAEKQALKKWRFIPATRDGIKVEEWQTITISFTIN